MSIRSILFILAGILFLIGITLFIPSKVTHSAYLTVKTGTISLITAYTEAEHELGLGGRDSLPRDSGMLFIFKRPDTYAFWMKNMKFPIDIIWLDENYIVVDMKENVDPSTYPEEFVPQKKSLYVLEANAHFVEKNSLKIGDTLALTLIK